MKRNVEYRHLENKIKHLFSPEDLGSCEIGQAMVYLHYGKYKHAQMKFKWVGIDPPSRVDIKLAVAELEAHINNEKKLFILN